MVYNYSYTSLSLRLETTILTFYWVGEIFYQTVKEISYVFMDVLLGQ